MRTRVGRRRIGHGRRCHGLCLSRGEQKLLMAVRKALHLKGMMLLRIRALVVAEMRMELGVVVHQGWPRCDKRQLVLRGSPRILGGERGLGIDEHMLG